MRAAAPSQSDASPSSDDAPHAARARSVDALRRVFSHALESRGRPVIGRVPAPLAPVDTLARAEPSRDATLFSSPRGPSLATLGTHCWIEARGADRMARLRAGIERALAGVEVVACAGATTSVARVVGGMAFAPGAADRSPWNALGDAAFVMPVLTYERTACGAELSVLFDPASGTAGLRGALDEASDALELLGSERAARRGPPPRTRTLIVETSESWGSRIEEILGAIGRGEVRKVVAARCVRARCDARLDPLALASDLGARCAGTTMLALRARGVAFVAATPERLVAKEGSEVLTMALAGSADPRELQAASSLWSSEKDRREHELVVSGISASLSALCVGVETDSEPRVCALPNVLHLETRIRAHALPGTHVLDLVAALHPTAAVAGTPTAGALAWIEAHEPEPRGWYAAPFGWVDAHGDGELVVALRSALLRGTDAWVYGGAGIVSGSEQSEELAETDCKMRPMLAALGAVP